MKNLKIQEIKWLVYVAVIPKIVRKERSLEFTGLDRGVKGPSYPAAKAPSHPHTPHVHCLLIEQ